MPKARKRRLGKEMLELIADRFRILGDPLRLRLLHHLREGEASVGDLVEASDGTQANVSRHLQILLRAGVVTRRKEGLHVYYRIADPSVLELCELVCGSLEDRLTRDLSTVRGRR